MTSRTDRGAGRLRRVAMAALALALLGSLTGPRRAAAQGVHLAVTPANLAVNIGSTFDLDLTVTPAGSSFNGFDATVSYDPAALTLIPLSPTTAQQGCLMTGGCSAACGTTFHHFTASGDSAAISDVLLCNQISLTGPGQVYRLRFQASNTQQTTHVRIRRATFYNAGLYVTPVETADAVITIGTGVGVGPGPDARGLSLHAEPNPARGSTVFVLEADVAGEQRLEIHDLAGRLVRVVDRGWRESGVRRVRWDGRDTSGAPVRAGVYLASYGVGDRLARIRVVVMR